MQKIVYVVGIGPGDSRMMTREAWDILTQCEYIVGYTTYVELIRSLFPQATFVTMGMRKEKERCREALRLAELGHKVALISSGDAGVYGMAGIIRELGVDYPHVTIQGVPGVTVALSGAALLGAPLVHDTCFISLSDALTSWEIIEKRLKYAAMGDFVIVLYNPASKRRPDYVQRAYHLIAPYRQQTTPIGIVQQVGRIGEKAWITTLKEMETLAVDMFTTIFIGNSQTKVIEGKMVTPRGYSL